MSRSNKELLFASTMGAYSSNPASSYFFMKGTFGSGLSERLGIRTDLDIEAEVVEAARRRPAINVVSNVLTFLVRHGTYELMPLWDWATTDNDNLYHADVRQEPLGVVIAQADKKPTGWDGVKRVMHAAYTDGLVNPGYDKLPDFPRN